MKVALTLNFFTTVSLIVSTVLGLRWFLELTADDSHFDLKLSYYIEAIVLLAIPMAVATFFVIILLIFIGIVVLEYRNRAHSA